MQIIHNIRQYQKIDMRRVSITAFVVGLLSINAHGVQDSFRYGPSIGNSYGPEDWDKVDCAEVDSCPGWPTNWEKLNSEIPYEGEDNNCMDCSDPAFPNPRCSRARQSPIDLEKGLTEHYECVDRHRMNYRAGTCRFGSLKFEVMPHVLRVHQPEEECNEMPNIDFSQGFPDPWHLAFTDISVPAHHALDGKRYAAEVVLSHTYSVKNRTDRLIGNVSILLEKGNETDRYDFLDLYIKQFEEEALRTYRLCKRNLSSTRPVQSGGKARRLRKIPRHKEQTIQTAVFNRTFNPYDFYLKTGTEYYWRYEGTTLVPPCLQTVHWRVLKNPVKVAPSQILDLERLLAQSRSPKTCQLDTVGRRPHPLSVRVEFNRPLQVATYGHRPVFCECVDWRSHTDADREWCNLSPEARGVVVHPTQAPSTVAGGTLHVEPSVQPTASGQSGSPH